MVRGFLIGSLLAGLAALPGRAQAEAAPSSAPTPGLAAPRGGPSRAPSSAAHPPATTGAAATSERARLAVELDRINAEIDALKRSTRGLRDDYRLRNRMADAEALAHRLTELDARSDHPRAPNGVASPPAAWPSAVPVGAGDDRADLEAKADILSDQAGRLTAEADRIQTRITDLRARRELRRRAGQLERDPFSPLEQAKSRIVVTGKSANPSGGGPKSSDQASGAEDRTAGTTAPPTASGAGPTAAPAAPGGTNTGPPSGGGTLTVDSSTASGTVQLRGVLDPSSLAEIRRLEAPGAGPANLATLEGALGTLRARSADLARNAAALRARAAKRP